MKSFQGGKNYSKMVAEIIRLQYLFLHNIRAHKIYLLFMYTFLYIFTYSYMGRGVSAFFMKKAAAKFIFNVSENISPK